MMKPLSRASAGVAAAPSGSETSGPKRAGTVCYDGAGKVIGREFADTDLAQIGRTIHIDVADVLSAACHPASS